MKSSKKKKKILCRELRQRFSKYNTHLDITMADFLRIYIYDSWQVYNQFPLAVFNAPTSLFSEVNIIMTWGMVRIVHSVMF